MAESELTEALASAVESTRAAVAAEYIGMSEESDATLKAMQKAHEDDKAAALRAAARRHEKAVEAAIAAAKADAAHVTEGRLVAQHETTLAAAALLLRQTEESGAEEMKEAVANAVKQTMTDTEARLREHYEAEIQKVILEERAQA
eukprot:6365154-Prymnesium_polylepis.1